MRRSCGLVLRRRLTTVLAAVLCVLVGCDGGESSSTDFDESGNADASPAPPAVTDQPAPRPEPLPTELMEVVRFSGRGQFAVARGLAQRYEEAHPDDGRAAFMIGLTYHTAGNHGAAVPHFERALRRSPDYYVTHHYFGDCLFLLGDMAGSRREQEAHQRADPTEPDAAYGIGLVDLEESRLEDAEAQFRHSIDLYETMKDADPRKYGARQPSLAACHARLADVYFARDDYESARAELIAATMIEPRNISAFYTLSLVHRRLGEEELADAALNRYEQAKEAIIRGRQGGGG